MKWWFLAGGIAVIYFVTKPTVQAGCLSAINPFTGRPMSTCAGNVTGNIAGANVPIPSGPTNTDTGGLNSNGGYTLPNPVVTQPPMTLLDQWYRFWGVQP